MNAHVLIFKRCLSALGYTVNYFSTTCFLHSTVHPGLLYIATLTQEFANYYYSPWAKSSLPLAFVNKIFFRIHLCPFSCILSVIASAELCS